jgi:hypothetical protein
LTGRCKSNFSFKQVSPIVISGCGDVNRRQFAPMVIVSKCSPLESQQFAYNMEYYGFKRSARNCPPNFNPMQTGALNEEIHSDDVLDEENLCALKNSF